MDSTLLPTAARLRQSRQEDVGGIFSSQSAMMLCGHAGALQVGPPARRPPAPPHPGPGTEGDHLGITGNRGFCSAHENYNPNLSTTEMLKSQVLI